MSFTTVIKPLEGKLNDSNKFGLPYLNRASPPKTKKTYFVGESFAGFSLSRACRRRTISCCTCSPGIQPSNPPPLSLKGLPVDNKIFVCVVPAKKMQWRLRGTQERPVYKGFPRRHKCWERSFTELELEMGAKRVGPACPHPRPSHPPVVEWVPPLFGEPTSAAIVRPTA